MDDKICPAGLLAARRRYKARPNTPSAPMTSNRARQYAKNVCNGMPEQVPSIRLRKSGAPMRYDEAVSDEYTNACSRASCSRKGRRCRPRDELDNLSEPDRTSLCTTYALYPPSAAELVGTAKFVAQVVHKGKVFGFLDEMEQFHVCRPGDPLPGLESLTI